jgi:hypothetical protein
MKLSNLIVFAIVLAIVGASVGLAYPAGDGKEPGFNALDKNNDGYLSRVEAAGDSGLTKKFKDADRNGDGRVSRAEYLAVKGKDEKPASSGATSK